MTGAGKAVNVERDTANARGRLRAVPRDAAGTRRSAAAFTLLEILLSIAIIALLAAVLIGGAVRLLSDQPATVHDVFFKAVQEARKTALKIEHEIRLKYDKDKKQFVLIDGLAPSSLAADGFTKQETPLKTFPIPSSSASADLSVDFLPAATKGFGNLIVVRGAVIETQTIPFVTFYSDGTCTSFRTQFVRNGQTSTPLVIDPWTCAPVLTPTDPNAPPAP